jgi:hypothetical protein
MRAQIAGLHNAFEVEPVRREDGTVGPPLSVTLTLRNCWRVPARRMDLVFLYEFDGVAVYGVKHG